MFDPLRKIFDEFHRNLVRSAKAFVYYKLT